MNSAKVPRVATHTRWLTPYVARTTAAVRDTNSIVGTGRRRKGTASRVSLRAVSDAELSHRNSLSARRSYCRSIESYDRIQANCSPRANARVCNPKLPLATVCFRGNRTAIAVLKYELTSGTA
jgi:hypothetical protein